VGQGEPLGGARHVAAAVDLAGGRLNGLGGWAGTVRPTPWALWALPLGWGTRLYCAPQDARVRSSFLRDPPPLWGREIAPHAESVLSQTDGRLAKRSRVEELSCWRVVT
jgi:hypothetical protein